MAKNKERKDITRASYLKDGYLVVGIIRRQGCTSYVMHDKDEKIDGETLTADWMTQKTCSSVTEEKAMLSTCYELNKKVFQLGVRISNFGTVVPYEKGAELEKAMTEIDEGVKTYNATAKYTRLFAELSVFLVDGGDEKVAKVMYNRVVESLTSVKDAIDKGDIKGLRESLNDLSGIDSILPMETGEKLSKQIESARKAARQAVQATKDIGRDSEKAKTAAFIMSKVGVEGLRATFVEIAEQINDKAKTYSLPVVDARQIE